MTRKTYEVIDNVFGAITWAWVLVWATVTFLWLGSWIFGSGPRNQYVVVTALVGTIGFAIVYVIASIDQYLDEITKDDLEEEDY